MKFLFKVFIILLTAISIPLADEIKIFDFTEDELAELKVRKVRGADNKTLYSVGSN